MNKPSGTETETSSDTEETLRKCGQEIRSLSETLLEGGLLILLGPPFWLATVVCKKLEPGLVVAILLFVVMLPLTAWIGLPLVFLGWALGKIS